MTDARRSRWIAFDASFYDDTLGVMIREMFGPVGLVLFSAFLCGCKRSSVQGQMTYGTEADFLAQVGLPGLELVNESGEPFELQSFWSALAAHKQCSTRARGRLRQVTSTKWSKWQKGFASQQEAERKGTSRGRNTPDTPPPKPSRREAEKPPDIDLDFDTDTDTSSSSPQPPTDVAPASPEEEQEMREAKAATIVAERRLARREAKLGPVDHVPSWMRRATAEAIVEVRAMAPAYPDDPPSSLAELVLLRGLHKPRGIPPEMSPSYLRSADQQPEPVWDIDDNGMAVAR